MRSIRLRSIQVSSLAAMLFLAVSCGISASTATELDTTNADLNDSDPSEILTDASSEANEPDGSPGGRWMTGSSQLIGPGETVRDMVTIFGRSVMEGTVQGDMVTLFGNAVMTGRVQGDMVTLFGDANVDGRVDSDTVVVFGSLKVGPDAVLKGDCVVLFGKIDRDPEAALLPDAVEILPQLSGIKNYLVAGPLLGRPLPPGFLLAWIVVALHFVLYLLVAVIFPRPTAATVRELDENPFLCFGIGLLTKILLVPLAIIFTATGIGVLVLPLIFITEIGLGCLGKTAVLEYSGLQILRRFQSDADHHPIPAFFLGFILVTALYMVPVIGLMLWILLQPLALGAALLSVFRMMRSNGTGASAPGIPANPVRPPNSGDIDEADPTPSQAADSKARDSAPLAPKPSYFEAQPQHCAETESEPYLMPRAGFWIRLLATALDAVLLGWIVSFTGRSFLLFWLAYHIAMWTWKGTTIGGIICKLKVVRLDGNPLDFGVSLVRGLAAFFSAAALGLGFFWVGWTRDRESWHDRITGTIIVRVPESIKLI